MAAELSSSTWVFDVKATCRLEILLRSCAESGLWLQVKEELLLQQQEEAEAEEDFVVEDDDIELAEEETEEWTGFSEPVQDESAPEGPADAEETPSEHTDEPVASTSKPEPSVSSALLDTSEYEQSFDGEQGNGILTMLATRTG